MTESQLFEIITGAHYAETHESLNDITKRYVAKLAQVSNLLDDDDLAKFICIAIDLYQKGLKERKQYVNLHQPPERLQ